MAKENQSILIKILKGIGYYILGFSVIILLEYLLKFYKALPEVGNVGPSMIYFLGIIMIPLSLIFFNPKKKAIIIFFSIYLAFAIIMPRVYCSISGDIPKEKRYTNQSRSPNSNSVDGTYYVDEGDRIIKLIVGGDKWHCTINMDGVSDEVYGYLKDEMLMDSRNDIPIGEVNGSSAEITVYSRQSTLYKDSN